MEPGRAGNEAFKVCSSWKGLTSESFSGCTPRLEPGDGVNDILQRKRMGLILLMTNDMVLENVACQTRQVDDV